MKQPSDSNLLQQSRIDQEVHLLKAFNELRNGITQVTPNRQVIKIFHLTISLNHLPSPRDELPLPPFPGLIPLKYI